MPTKKGSSKASKAKKASNKQRKSPKRGVTGRAGATRVPFTVEDVATSTAVTPVIGEQLLAAGLRAILAVPLLREDRVDLLALDLRGVRR